MLNVLTVCTGNICRSPAAELFLDRELYGKAQVASAGTGAMVGCGIDPDTAAVLESMTYGNASFRSRQLTAQLVREADLVLTATAEHRSAVVTLVPGAVRRTFTLLEFARLVQPAASRVDTSAGRLDRHRQIVRIAASSRASHSGELDVADPYRKGPDAHRLAVTTIREACARIGYAMM